MALVVEGVVRAGINGDSFETETDSVHVGSDVTVTSMCVGPDSTINSISQMSSLYTDCLPVSCKNHFSTGTGECSMEYAVASSANGLGFSPAGAESSDAYESSLILGTVMDYQPSVVPIYGNLLGLTMLWVYPVKCGNKPRVWFHLTAVLELEVI